jgi:hypothetical protein
LAKAATKKPVRCLHMLFFNKNQGHGSSPSERPRTVYGC